MNTHLREVQRETIDGDVYQYFESLVDKIITSGDESDTKFLSFDSSEPPCPIGPGQFTRLKLTDGSCNLTSFTSSFIKLKIKTTVGFNFGVGMRPIISSKIDSAMNDCPCFYVGFKSGIHAIDHYRFYCDKGRGYMCEQSQAVYESAVTYMVKSQEEIEGEQGCYATMENIRKLDPNVPGRYITWKEFKDHLSGSSMDIEFEVVIKYDDFAPLQFFKSFPNDICGNIQLEFKIANNKNIVFCQVPFEAQIAWLKKHRAPQLMESALADEKVYMLYGVECEDNSFANMGDDCPFRFIDDMATAVSTVQGFGGALYLNEARSYINGYNIKQNKMSEIRDLLSTKKIYIPAQRIDQYSFSQTPTSSNMSCNTTQSLVNCSSIAFMFPRTSNQLTCSFNPGCNSIQLQIDNKTYPDKPFSTTSLEHSNYILNNLMFDDLFKPNTSLYNSLKKYAVEPSDYSNYLFVVSTERLDSDPYVFDGITKDNCYITLIGTFTSDQSYAGSRYKQPPIMLICQDTLWELSSEGVNYYYNNKNIIQSITNN